MWNIIAYTWAWTRRDIVRRRTTPPDNPSRHRTGFEGSATAAVVDGADALVAEETLEVRFRVKMRVTERSEEGKAGNGVRPRVRSETRAAQPEDAAAMDVIIFKGNMQNVIRDESDRFR